MVWLRQVVIPGANLLQANSSRLLSPSRWRQKKFSIGNLAISPNKETHGFASRPRDRFAFIRELFLSSFSRHWNSVTNPPRGQEISWLGGKTFPVVAKRTQGLSNR